MREILTALQPAFIALVGSFVGGFFTLLGVNYSHKKDIEKQNTQEKKLIKSVLQSIRAEIDTLWNQYKWGIGEKLEALKEGEALMSYYPVTQEYFNIYNSNSMLIGRIDDKDLAKKIISTYALAKGLIDSYRMNNDLISKYEQAFFLHKQTQTEALAQQIKMYYRSLVQYSSELKEIHNKLGSNVTDLLKSLEDA